MVRTREARHISADFCHARFGRAAGHTRHQMQQAYGHFARATDCLNLNRST
jgi:hypothetical protein